MDLIFLETKKNHSYNYHVPRHHESQVDDDDANCWNPGFITYACCVVCSRFRFAASNTPALLASRSINAAYF